MIEHYDKLTDIIKDLKDTDTVTISVKDIKEWIKDRNDYLRKDIEAAWNYGDLREANFSNCLDQIFKNNND